MNLTICNNIQTPMRLPHILLFVLLLGQVLSADSFTLCYGNCNTCSATDFTYCTNTSSSPCVYGYALFDSACNPVASFNNYATQFAQPNTAATPANWISSGNPVTSTLTCNTIRSQQAITLIGPFSNQQVTKTYTVAPRTNMFVQLYFLRMGWGASDSVNISVSSGGSVIYNEIVASSSYMSLPNSVNYLADCGNVAAAQLWGAQITLVSNVSSNASTITLTFTPSVSSSSQWAFSNVKVSTGCGSFMVSHNGTCNSCLSGYYYNRITLDCQKCNPLCTSCFGPTNTNCLSCPLESVLNGNTCVYSSNFYVMNDVFVDNGTVGNTSSCSNTFMLGGPTYGQITNVLSRKYILPRHMLLKLSFWLTQIGDWSNVTRFTASIDGTPYITISNFQQPGISPLCLQEVGPVLVTTSQHYSNFMSHTNSETTLTFSVEGVGNANTLFGINDISLVAFNCPPQCSECTLTANFTPNCLRCNQFLSQTSGCLLCPNGFFLDTSNQYSTICRKCYSTCLECNGLTQQNCTACFPGYMLVGSYCTPNTSLSYTLYSQQLTRNVFNYQDYTVNTGGDISCGPYRIFGNSASSPTTLSRTWRSLPTHKGLILNMQLFKLGPWTTGENITLKLDNNQVIVIPVNQSAGSNLCTSGNSDFVYTLSVPLSEHVSNNLAMEVSGSGGLAVGTVILSLQNCPDCSNSQFGYEVQYIPKYTLDNNQYGLNTWLKFNKNVRNVNVTELAENFQLYINAIPLNVTEWDNINDLRLYTPFPSNYSFINGTLTILNKNPSQVISFANTNIPPQELTTIRSETKVARYDTLANDDYLVPINQLYNLFKGYAEAILYIAISFIGLGLGLVSEEFVAVLQIIFMHIYVMTHWLPATHKLPLSGMQRIEHLNYFMRRDINRIQGAILPKGLHQVSPHTFEQYHTDINFVRASYPIVVLNLIYLAYWIIMYTVYRCCPGFRRSPNVVVRWFRQIVQRPLNFFDYFFRLEFITVAWSCFCQYTHFYSSPVKSFRDFNYFWTILFFVCLCFYPFVIVCYLLRMRGITLKETFNYQYQDIFFMRIKRNHDEMSSFIYILVRFLRYFIICCFMAFFASGSIVGPILCMIMTAVETLFILFRTIYVDPFYLLFKLVENLFLFLLDIIYIIIFATANQWSLPSYLNLGYVANAFIIVLLINASLRALYILYLKIRTFCGRNYRLDRAYNTSSFGFDYKPAPVMEMARLSGIQNAGVMGSAGMLPPAMMGNNMGAGYGGIGVPFGGFGGSMNMIGGNIGSNMMIQNPMRTSTTTIMNQGANYGINTIGMNANPITTIPPAPMKMSVVNNVNGPFGLNQGFSQQAISAEVLPTTSVHRIRQQTHIIPQYNDYNTTNINFNANNNRNIENMLAQGANKAGIGRGSLHGGDLMLASNVQGYSSSYGNNNLIEPYHEDFIYEENRVMRNSQVNRF